MPPALPSKVCGLTGITSALLISPGGTYGPGPRVIAFVLNTQINSVKTPDMLKLWGYTSSAECSLCLHKQCTLHHILVNCHFALDQGRYTWRHDSVLANIEPALQTLITALGRRKPVLPSEAVRKAFHCCFVREGSKPSATKSQTINQGLLLAANDWKLLVDYDHKQIVFPPNIYSTNERRDIVLDPVELTCCAEEGVALPVCAKEYVITPSLTTSPRIAGERSCSPLKLVPVV